MWYRLTISFYIHKTKNILDWRLQSSVHWKGRYSLKIKGRLVDGGSAASK